MSKCDGTREGAWILTFTGKKFWPLDPRPQDIDIRDIAHGLCQWRYTAQSPRRICVAEHSVRVSDRVARHGDLVALAGLLHDASEAYLCDLTKPLKMLPEFAFYREAEARLQSMIYALHGIPEEPREVVAADELLLSTEATSIWDKLHPDWPLPVKPLPVKIQTWCWEDAEQRFLDRYAELTKRLREAGRQMPSCSVGGAR